MKKIAYVVPLLLLSSACGNEEAEQAARNEINREIEERAALEMKLANEGRAELLKKDKQQLVAVLELCQMEILKQARQDNTGPFDVFLVDEYSADVYQAGAYLNNGKVKSDEERAADFLASKDQSYPILDTRYTVMFTVDSFSGPQKKPVNYSCDVLAGMKMKASMSY